MLFFRLLKIFICFEVSFLTMILIIPFGIFTLFRTRRIYVQLFIKPMCHLILFLCGISVKVTKPYYLPENQSIYVFNHTSNFDPFILCSLGLPNTRFFLSEGFSFRGNEQFLPMTVMATMMGTFFTPSQDEPQKRALCFQHAERILRQTNDSVLLSPEGLRNTTGEIGKFNKGAFHLATNLKWSIYPVYFSFPEGVNPGTGYKFSSGEIGVHFLPKIDTKDWKLDDLEKNKKIVRSVFCEFHQTMGSDKKVGDDLN